jgi:hypothetical protein
VPDQVCKGLDRLAAQEYRPPALDDEIAAGTAPKLIDVEILGHIFKQSIDDLEQLHQEIAKRGARPRLFAISSVFEALQEIATNDLIGEARVYGGGLYKIEPMELAQIEDDEIVEAMKDQPTERTRAALPPRGRRGLR